MTAENYLELHQQRVKELLVASEEDLPALLALVKHLAVLAV